jgi:hypothetical protein
MSWHFLYQEGLKNETKNISAEGSEAPFQEPSVQAMPAELGEAYQKKLFENDLYVWSLLLLGNNDI